MPRSSIALIIVTHNSARFFKRMHEALEALTLKPDELLIIDSGSDPDQCPSKHKWPMQAHVHVAQGNIGFAAANNLGVAMTKSDLICLLNPDAFPEPDWLLRLSNAAATYPSAAAFGSTQISLSMDKCFDGLGDCYHVSGLPWRGGFGAPITSDPPPTGAVFSPCAAAALYRRTVWCELEGFDERFFCYCEDVDLGFRIRLAGHDILQIGAAIVHHVGGASSGRRSEFAVFHGTRNRFWTYVKNMPDWAFWVLLPAHLGVTGLFLIVSPFRGTGPATWKGVFAALAGISDVWRDRRKVQKKRKARVNDILSAMAWSPLYMVQRAPVVRLKP
jgi:GT2 family glycosyltransferase